jgi:hypothetical protein
MPATVELLLRVPAPLCKCSHRHDVEGAEERRARHFPLPLQPAGEVSLAHVKCLSQLPSPAQQGERAAQGAEPGIVWHAVDVASSAPPPNRRILGPGGCTQEIAKHFRREGAGVWVCVAPTTLDLPQGRVQAVPGTRFVIGTKYMNVDVARLLDEEYSRQKGVRD